MVNEPYWARSFKPLTVGVWLYYAPNWNVQGLLAHLGIFVMRKWKARANDAAAAEEHV
jgi:hypothetical protein